MILGRFAPSPTGQLHLGSLTTAVASYCHIKSLGGKWLVRIEDTDFERCKASYTASILSDLDNLGLHSDGQILYQSQRVMIYDEFLHDALKHSTYLCTCSRKQLSQLPAPKPHLALQSTQDLHASPIYPRWCLHHPPQDTTNAKIRLTLSDTLSVFYDGLMGLVWDNPAYSLGDVVVKRQNGMINYILSCAIDDGLQSISHVMRGMDILPMTQAQLDIIKRCGLPTPDYFYHLPLLHNADGQKLSKQNLASPIDTTNNLKCRQLLIYALDLLGQDTPKDLLDGSIDDILQFGITHWDNTPLKHRYSLGQIKNHPEG